MRKSFLLICIILCIISSTIAQKRVVCYWDSKSSRHEGMKGYFTVTDIDPNLCTHIIYTHVQFLQSVNIVPINIDEAMQAFVQLKQRNPKVKLLIGVGGPSQASQFLSAIASFESDRVLSAFKIKTFIDKYGLDGVDFDWQYPNQGTGSQAIDVENFVKMLGSWRANLTSSKIISISVGARQEDIRLSYDIPGIVQHVDFINLNSYNLRGSSKDTVTAFHSPYRKEAGENDEAAEWNAESIVNNWLSHNCPAEKLTLGIATYGRSYTLSDVSQTGVGAPVNGIGKVSSYFRDLGNNAGIVPYAEICSNVAQNNWNENFDEGHFAYYAVYDNDQWVSYDSRDSVLAKVHLAINKGLGGINYASIDRDDFSNECGFGNFPLIKIGYDGIVNDILDENPLEKDTTLTETTSSTPLVTSPSTSTPFVTSPSTSTEPQTTTSSFATPPTTTRTTTSRTTTTQLPDDFTPPLLTGPLTTISKPSDDDSRETTSSSTSSTTKRPSASTMTSFPTPPTQNGLKDVELTTVDTTVVSTTQSSTVPSTLSTTKKTTTTTTHFPTPPVLANANSFSIDIFACPEPNGYFENPQDCSTYYNCVDNIAYKLNCVAAMNCCN